MTFPLPLDDAARPAGPSPAPPGPPGTPGPAGPSEPAATHLDDLEAMLLAEGQPVDPPLARHATACARCSALVSAFRSEGASLISALALDASEMAFLAAAGLPGQVAARVARSPFLAGQRDSWATLLAMLITALAGYGGWLLVQPVLAAGLVVAERSGAIAVATRLVTDWLVGLLFTLWEAAGAVASLPLVDNPALPLALVALLGWLAIWLGPRLHLTVPRARAAA